MKHSSMIFTAATSAAITLATVLPAGAAELDTSACAGITDRTEMRLCMRAQWQDAKTDRMTVRTTAKETNTATRTEAKEGRDAMHTEMKADHEAELAKCAELRANTTVTNGMIAVADADAVISCYRNIMNMKKEHMSEQKEVRQEARTQVRANNQDTRATLQEMRKSTMESRRMLRTQRLNRIKVEATGAATVDM